MTPEERLRGLKDPDRWMNIRLPRPTPGLAHPERRSPEQRARVVLAFAIALIAVAGLWFGLSALRPTSQPAQPATPAPVATAPTATPAAATMPCPRSAVSVRTSGAPGAAAGNWVQPLSFHNSGPRCVLPTAAVTVSGRAARAIAGTGRLALPAHAYIRLYLMAGTSCRDGAMNLNRKVLTTIRLTLDGRSTSVGSFPALHCAAPILER